MLIIEEIKLDDVLNNPEDYNSSNHWDYGKPDDYEEKYNLSRIENWIDAFHSTYKKIIIGDEQKRWMKECYNICKHSGVFSKIYEDDINNLIEKYKNFELDKPYFVRCSNVSLKYGIHKTGPYTSLRQIIESAVSSISGHSPSFLYKDDEPIVFYLLEWKKIDINNEYRVFVKNKQITCVSQQNVYKSNDLFNNPDKYFLGILHFELIKTFFEESIRDKIIHTRDYVMDIAILSEDELYFIEMNCFGKEYSSGSALFHWIKDYDKLYGKTPNTYFRYSKK